MWALESRSPPFGGATQNGYAFAKGNHYVQQHIVADLSASDSLANHIKGFFPNFVRINCSFELFVELTLSDRTHSGLRLCSDVLAG